MTPQQKQELVQAQTAVLEYLRSVSAPAKVLIAATAVQIVLAKKEPVLPNFVQRD